MKGKLRSRMEFPALRSESGEVMTNADDIVNSFNAYFSTNFNQQEYTVPSLPYPHLSTLDSIKLTTTKVFNVIKKLPASVSNDHEKISYLLIKKGGVILAEKLSHFFNLSMTVGKIPDSWRRIIIRPIHKSGAKDSCANYRPIAIP